MAHGDQGAVGLGPERDRLAALRLMADLAVLLRAGELDLHRSSGDFRGRGRQDDVRPDIALGAEAAAGVRGDDAHLLGRQAEHGGHDVARMQAHLGGVPQGQRVAVPGGDRRRGLHRIVVTRRLVAALRNDDVGGREAGGDIPLGLLRRSEAARRPLQLAVAGRGGGGGLDLHADQRCGLLGGFERLGQHDGDRLPLPLDVVGGERHVGDRRGRLDLAQRRHLGAGDHLDHAGRRPGAFGLDPLQHACGDRRADDHAMQQVRGIVVRRIDRRAGDLDRRLVARGGLPDGHAAASTIARAAAPAAMAIL